MDEYYMSGRGRVPAFGSWDYNDGLPFTECFERARQAGLIPYHNYASQDCDLYGGGGGGGGGDDLYQHDVTPAPTMILVPRRKVKEGKGGKEEWVVCDYEMEVKEPPSPLTPSPPWRGSRAPKAVDEDLYRISPELLYTKSQPTKRRVWGFLSCCREPSCVQ